MTTIDSSPVHALNWRKTRAKINLSGLSHNLSIVRQLSGQQKIMAVIKANAYGHGLLPIARQLAPQVDAFAVATLDEALLLRQQGITTSIVLLEGFISSSELPLLAKHQLIPVIHNFNQLNILTSVQNTHKNMAFWLKFDTGMHRLGFQTHEIDDLAFLLSKTQHNCIGIMSHAACADEPAHPLNQTQQQTFEKLQQHEAFSHLEKSMANSAIIMAHPQMHYDWLRPGIMLYGINPMLENDNPSPLQAVMQLQAPIIAIKQCKKGQKLGYGQTWQAKQDTDYAVIAIGYGDGYPRHAPSDTPVELNGTIVPLIGRVSMDMICVDISKLPSQSKATIGDIATLWGQKIPVESIADYAGTIAYELLCGVTQRVEFIYETE